MRDQYTINFPTIEMLCAFKLTIHLEAYIIDVTKKTLKCNCSNLELKDAVNKFNGLISTITSGLSGARTTVKFTGNI